MKKFDIAIIGGGILGTSISYWINEVYSCVTINRDLFWFETHKPTIIDFWKNVEYYRNAGVENIPNLHKSKKKKTKCMLLSD